MATCRDCKHWMRAIIHGKTDYNPSERLARIATLLRARPDAAAEVAAIVNEPVKSENFCPCYRNAEMVYNPMSTREDFSCIKWEPEKP